MCSALQISFSIFAPPDNQVLNVARSAYSGPKVRREQRAFDKETNLRVTHALWPPILPLAENPLRKWSKPPAVSPHLGSNRIALPSFARRR